MPTFNYDKIRLTDMQDATFGVVCKTLCHQVATEMGWNNYDDAHNEACFAFFNSWEPHFTVREWITTAGEWLDVDTSRCEGICFILPDGPAWQASGETPLQYYARLAETARAANTEDD